MKWGFNFECFGLFRKIENDFAEKTKKTLLCQVKMLTVATVARMAASHETSKTKTKPVRKRWFVMATINQVCDYIILACQEGGERLNLLKLQKLLYYAQAWNLAINGKPLFAGKFQAWVHGPVNREIYNRFSGAKSLYSAVDQADMTEGFTLDNISPDDRQHIDNVLEVYAPFSGSDLEAQTHSEDPWIRARGTCKPTERCENELDEAFMASYYKQRLN